MRILILVSALALASCGDGQPTTNAAVGGESEAAEIFAANDITAIDAATGEAADMAADVNYVVDTTGNDIGNDTGSGTADAPPDDDADDRADETADAPAETPADDTADAVPANTVTNVSE